jgi:F0F1-type ATP synthase membrane subunit b/b'
MPQLDPRFFASQFFWVIVCFVIFYACAHFLIVPRLRSILDTRLHVNEKNKTTAHMLSLQSAELKSESHIKTVQMQNYIDEIKTKYENKFQEYNKHAMDEFNDKIKLSYEATKLEVENHKKVLSEKATTQYVSDLAAKVVMKLTGVRS